MAKNSEYIVSVLSNISSDADSLTTNAKEQIVVLDTAKIPFDKTIKNLDKNIYEEIKTTNNTLTDVQTKYQDRIDAGARSDLFWRVISWNNDGGSTNSIGLRCEKLSPSYSIVSNPTPSANVTGFTTNAVMIYEGNGNITTYDGLAISGDRLVSAGSNLDSFYEADNLHGIKLYDEPYAKDIGNTKIKTKIGICGIGSTFITLLTRKSVENIGLSTGNIITTPFSNVIFTSNSNSIVGFGTTTLDLSGHTFTGVSTTSSTVPIIYLQNSTIGAALGPNTSGEYTKFTFSIDPDTISDEYAISIEDSPYTDQSIKIMDSNSEFGTGVKIEYVNDGKPDVEESWNQFMDGYPNPEDLDVNISEPNVGADKIYYSVGFTKKPTSGGDASEGTTRTVTGLSVNTYTNLTSNDAADAAIDAAITARNTAESNLSSNTTFSGMINLSNEVRKQRNDKFNLRIWAYRGQIGQAGSEKTKNDDFTTLIENSEFKETMDLDS